VDSSVLIAIIALISSLGGIIVANRYTARTARQAQETTAEIESRKLDASSWQESLKLWKDDVKVLREQIKEDNIRYENDKAKMSGEIDAMREELRQVHKERTYDRVQIDAMVAWGKTVVVMMEKAGIPFPPAPRGILDTIPPGAMRPIQ
jgi:hypothetical protein